MKNKVTVLGGDARQIHLARLLHDDGFEVVTWGLEKGEAPFQGTLEEALDAKIVILPLPVCRGNNLNLPLADSKLSVQELWNLFRREQIIFGGMFQAVSPELMESRQIEIVDYNSYEELRILNAISTAEGAIMRAMEETEQSLNECSCLVAGYGRIGKILAHRLRGLCGDITVTARKRKDLAWVKAFGYDSIHMNQLFGNLEKYDLIFNTVPTVIFDEETVKGINKNCILMELASMPGGFDLYAVKENHLRYIEERGLPGKVAPLSAAISVRDVICNVLKERGISI